MQLCVSETEDLSALRVQEDLLSAGLPDDLHPDAHPAAGLLPAGRPQTRLLPELLVSRSLNVPVCVCVCAAAAEAEAEREPDAGPADHQREHRCRRLREQLKHVSMLAC